MAISPDELLSFLSANEVVLVARLEKEIDEYLKKNWQGGSIAVPLEIDKEGVRMMSVVSVLCARYRAAGWSKASFVSDPRDGDCLELDK